MRNCGDSENHAIACMKCMGEGEESDSFFATDYAT